MASAKKVVKKSEEVSVEAIPEVVVDNQEENAGVTIDTSVKVTQEAVNSAEKMVKVATNRDHKCMVGGETYYFTKGKQVSVPFNVKTILKQAGVLAAF